MLNKRKRINLLISLILTLSFSGCAVLPPKPELDKMSPAESKKLTDEASYSRLAWQAAVGGLGLYAGLANMQANPPETNAILGLTGAAFGIGMASFINYASYKEDSLEKYFLFAGLAVGAITTISLYYANADNYESCQFCALYHIAAPFFIFTYSFSAAGAGAILGRITEAFMGM